VRFDPLETGSGDRMAALVPARDTNHVLTLVVPTMSLNLGRACNLSAIGLTLRKVDTIFKGYTRALYSS
jgi:hypothetical protein